jgi:hypothetical protein
VSAYLGAVLTPRPHRTALLAAVVGLAAVALGCAEVDRTVINRDFLQNDVGTIERAVVWESNRYADHQTHAGDACYEAAAIGEPVPDSCITARAVFSEADPHGQWPLVAYPASALAIAALVLFAARRVAWQPRYDPRLSATDTPPPSEGSLDIGVMRSIARDRVGADVIAARRRDVRRPALVGAAVAAAALLPLVLLVGYGATLIWAVHTGTALFIGLAVAVVMLLLRLPPRPANTDAHISRLQFLGGATVVLTVGAFLAAFWRLPMVELNGIALLG